MADVRTVRLSRQLEAQANDILSKTGAELAHKVLETCGALLRVADDSADPGQLEELDRDILMDKYQKVADRLSDFIRISGVKLNEEDTLYQGSGEYMRQLRRARRELNDNARAMIERIQTLDGEIDVLQKSITSIETRKKDLDAEETALQTDLNDRPPERISILKDQIQKLLNLIDLEKSKIEECEKEKEKWKTQLGKLQDKIMAHPGILASLSNENETIRRRIDRIENAGETCSIEKQEEIRDQLDQLTEQLEKDRQAYGDLLKRRNTLSESAEIQAEKILSLEEETIELIYKTIRELRPKLEDHQEVLERVEETDTRIRDGFKSCKTKQKQLTEWFSNDRVHLENLMKCLEKDGNTNLKGKLDKSTCDNIRNLFAQMQTDLNRMEEILKSAAEALKGSEPRTSAPQKS